MPVRLEELAKTIDHTLLDPEATGEDVDQLCEEAREHHVAAVCVLPEHVARAREGLQGCDVKVSAVVGLPHGTQPGREKVAGAEASVIAGAHELGVVMNLEAMWRGRFPQVRDELAAVVRAVRMRSVNSGRGQALVKVILDCARLDDKLKQLACRIVELVDADFAEISHGGTDDALVYEVELLRERLSERVAVKASGQIASVDLAQELVAAGAVRLGTTEAVALMTGARALA
jgi:deoxyribose-phosphate aldolase